MKQLDSDFKSWELLPTNQAKARTYGIVWATPIPEMRQAQLHFMTVI